MKLLLLGAVACILFIILDLIWFQFAGGFFKKEIGSIARLTETGVWSIRYIPAILVYVLMAVGTVVFVVFPAHSVTNAFLFGALFGFVGYGLYDLTNLATLSAWTTRFVIVDMLWGTFLCGTVATLVYTLSRLSFFS